MQSMTGFATSKGAAQGYSWSWDLRSVNGKGLDLKLRLPDWIDGLEPGVRAALARSVQRGSVTIGLRVTRDDAERGGLRVNHETLASMLLALAEVEDAAMKAGVTLAQASQADVLALRGVLDTSSVTEDTGPLRDALLADLPQLVAAFVAMRRAEGEALQRLLMAQLDRVEALTLDAALVAAERRGGAGAVLRDQLARILQNADGVDETRLAQELALIAVKQDVTEEVDRLTAHVAAARALLADKAPVGRKLDFLVQEFLREANTLCSKAQALQLTRIGLDLKHVIDQMREQIQNVE